MDAFLPFRCIVKPNSVLNADHKHKEKFYAHQGDEGDNMYDFDFEDKEASFDKRANTIDSHNDSKLGIRGCKP